MEAVVCLSESQKIPFSPHIITCKRSLHCVIGSEVSGFCSAIDIRPSLGLLLGILLLLCRDSATLGLQDQPLHVFQHITDGVDARIGQLITLVLGLGGCWVGQQMILLHPQYQGELSSTAPASSPYELSSQRKPGSPALISRVWLANMYTLGPAHLCCLGEV